MTTNKNIQQQVEASLNSLDGISKASPSPYFYTRIIAKLSNSQQTIWEKFSVIITRPVVAFACMCIIVLMNIIAVYSNSNTTSVSDQNEIAATDELTQATPAFYELENIKP